jgi:WD40 repeat protein
MGKLSGKDRCQVFAVDFVKGTAQRLTDFSYAHPQIVRESALKEAAFADEGGLVRLWPTTDGNLVLWILAAPGPFRIDPGTGQRLNVTRTPTLVAPDGSRRVEAKVKGSTTTLTLYDRQDQAQASVKVDGLVSHMRWSPNGSQVSFTIASLGKNGGVVQNLYLWDLTDGKDPMQMTSDGTSFGAEWLGAAQSWEP